MNSVRTILQEATKRLAMVSDTARLDAEVLLRHVSGLSRLDLITRENATLSTDLIDSFGRAVARRLASEPIAYITGEKEFWGLDFAVSPAVLIPRPETELLVERAIAHTAKENAPVRVLDLGTGSGCVIVSIVSELKKRGVFHSAVAVDLSSAAMAVATANAARHGLAADIEFRLGSWFEPVQHDHFDLIVSNPPYIRSDEELPDPVRFEPREALFSGSDGLDSIRHIFTVGRDYLRPRGTLLCEIGCEQSVQVRSLALEKGASSCLVFNDLAGLNRVIEAKW